MTRERRLTEEEEGCLGPVAIAQMVQLKWAGEWPLTVSRRGMLAFANGYFRMEGGHMRMPIVTEPSSRGAMWWPGRRVKPPTTIGSLTR